jgi:hypothetical protein
MFEYDRGASQAVRPGRGGGMLAAVASGIHPALAAPALAIGASHPAVAGLLGLGAAGLAGGVVAMAWSVHTRQIRLAEQLARRQFIVAGEPGPAGHGLNGSGSLDTAMAEAADAAAGGSAQPVIIEGPDTVVAGDQARYRVLPSASRKVVAWAAGGGPLSQCPDPSHADELLLIADRPGDLTVSVRVREGITERRATKSVTAVPDVSAPPPVTVRLFLQGWGLVVVAVLVIGFAGALDALGSLSSSDFIALVAPLGALLAVLAVVSGTGEAGSRPGGPGRGPGGPGA